MLSIQDLGLSVLGDAPKKFYIFGGPEYGIKNKYLEILQHKIGPKIEYTSVADVISLMTKFQIIPLPAQVYVVRYDKDFVKDITKDLAKKVLSLDIIGTLVLIYEDDKDINKLDKFFPDNTANIGTIDTKHMVKYLLTDFPKLDKRTAEFAAKLATNYYHAQNICRCLYMIQDNVLMTEKQISALFDITPNYSADDIQLAIASRSFSELTRIAEHYDGDLQMILYQILRVMVELDKCFDGKYVNSPLKKYAKQWTRADVYFMFNHTYNAISQLRAGYQVDVIDVITYLSALFTFKQVPSLQLMS